MKELGRLTLEEKVGQLFFLGFQESAPDTDTQALIDRIRPGGFIFFQRNIETLAQFYGLTTRLRETNGMPALLGIEHEGGRVDRLKQLFGPLPPMSELAAQGTAPLRSGARIIAAELEAAGLNLALAPVLDLSHPDSFMAQRTLSAEPAEAGRLGAAFIDELARKGILSCVKHFPGQGSTATDPHFGLPRIDRTKRQLLQEDALPFMDVLDEADIIMVSHAHFSGLGDEKPVPASLSPRVVDGFLRKKLGYTGVIMTDDMTMGAITSLGLTPHTFLAAFEAGNDMLHFSQTTPLVEQAFRLIVKSAKASEALRTRLDESVTRILALKSKIQYSPLRYRAHVRTRIQRQIEKLRATAELEHSPQAAERRHLP